MKSVAIYYFTGTGNTLRVVREMAGVFSERHIPTDLFPIERSDPRAVRLDGALGLAFPVAAQSTYPLVWRFIEGLPRAEGTGVFMADTLAGFSGGIVGPLKRTLISKGYRPLGAVEIIMPSNFFPGKRDPAQEAKTVAAGLAAARRFAESLTEGKGRWGRIPLLSDLICLISRSSLLWNQLRRFFPLAVDAARCTRCGVCARICPTGNIALQDLPVYAGRCELCMRCLSFCPASAISVPGKKCEIYRAAELREILGSEI